MKDFKHKPIWGEFGEFLHIQILSYLNWKDLLFVRLINLTGFQFVTNFTYRIKIGNYLKRENLMNELVNKEFNENTHIKDTSKLKTILEQIPELELCLSHECN